MLLRKLLLGVCDKSLVTHKTPAPPPPLVSVLYKADSEISVRAACSEFGDLEKSVGDGVTFRYMRY